MSRSLIIAGESGAGKTTSFRNLPPQHTMYIDCDKKGLSWKGWRSQYSLQNKNYIATDDAATVIKVCEKVHKEMPHIKYIVIDTINGIMVADEMRRSKEKGYDKWMDLAHCIWDVVDRSLTYRDDLTLIFTAHTQTDRDDYGYVFTRIKTSGRKLDKICLESKFTTVLLAKVVNGKHVFETHANNSTAKTPLGAFDADEIDNDIVKVLKVLDEF